MKDKKPCNCKAKEQLESIAKLLDEKQLEEVKKGNKWNYFFSTVLAKLLSYPLLPFLILYFIFHTLFSKSHKINLFSKLVINNG